jgi:hypothetical protein
VTDTPAQTATVGPPASPGAVSAVSPPVLIVGMHRSGTSLAARMLEAMGLNLGPPDRLAPAKPDNPHGFFENDDLIRLHDQMLDTANAAWDLPPDQISPALVNGWRRLFSKKAEELVAGIRAFAPDAPRWGFKDPRLCMVLPFWLQLYPAADLVICLRDPFAVAQSLRRRNYFSMRNALALVDAYLRHLESSAPDWKGRVVRVVLEGPATKPALAAERMAGLLLPLETSPAPELLQRGIAAHVAQSVHFAGTMADQPLWARRFPELGPRYARLLNAPAPSATPPISP